MIRESFIKAVGVTLMGLGVLVVATVAWELLYRLLGDPWIPSALVFVGTMTGLYFLLKTE